MVHTGVFTTSFPRGGVPLRLSDMQSGWGQVGRGGSGESDTKHFLDAQARTHTSKTRRRYQPCDNMVIVDLALGVPGNFPVGREDDGFGFGGRRGRQVDHIVGDNHILGGGRERQRSPGRPAKPT